MGGAGWNISSDCDWIKIELARILKASLNLGCIHNKWIDVKVVFIPKSDRAAYSVAKDYRKADAARKTS